MRGDDIRRRREALGWTQVELGNRAGVNKNTVTAVEKNRGVNTNSLLAIEDALTKAEARAAVSALEQSDAELVDIDVGHYKRADIPVLGPAEATTHGLITWSDEGVVRNQVERWISRPAWIRDQKAYGLIVRGDSMVPRYFPGELIIASPNAVVNSGCFACVILRNGARMIKRVYRQENGWNLISINEKYEPRFVHDDEVAAIHKVVHNSQDAIAVAREEVERKLKTLRTPKGIRRFAESHDPDRVDEHPEAASGDDDDYPTE